MPFNLETREQGGVVVLKVSGKNFHDFARLAMVGDRTWEKWMTAFSRPFTSAEIRYFEVAEREKALEWVTGVEAPSPAP